MKRRTFLKLAGLTAFLFPTASSASIQLLAVTRKKQKFFSDHIDDNRIKDYLTKIRNPDSPHSEDIILGDIDQSILVDVVNRLERLQKTIGYGNFGTLGFDEALQFARKNRTVGGFTKSEVAFLEMIFFKDALDYGFMGDKQIVNLTQVLKKSDIYRVPHNGNCLLKGESLDKYKKIKGEMGSELLLTSGIRGIIKQFYLFLNKACRHEGNLSLASRSLAPPGYSYHATGDFDIGQRGLGEFNFTEKFTATPVFKQLAAQGYVECRYQRDNMLGVRYEPWHIKLS